jgi:tetratricopeptide (TPR) repeat protein
MALLSSRAPVYTASLLLLLVLAPRTALAQKKITCPDGEHIAIDVKQISIQYDASSFAGTLSSLSVLSGRLEVAPKKLQEAAMATQQWDEFLKGLAAGYNRCAITRQQYADGLNRIYPRLKEDADGLEEIRKSISAGQKADAKRFQQLINSFYANLQQFAQTSGKEIILQRIEALSEQQKNDTQLILAKLNELEERYKQSPLTSPTEVNRQVSELRKSLLAKADDAEEAYNKAYDLLKPIPLPRGYPLSTAGVADVRLPAFYLALGRAYVELPDLNEAEKVLRGGLSLAGSDTPDEVPLANLLGSVLLKAGDLDGALHYTQRALQIAEKVYGPEPPRCGYHLQRHGADSSGQRGS